MKVIRKPKLDPRLMTQTELIAYVHELEAENARLGEENNHLLDKIQSFYKNEKLDLIDRERFLRELNDKIDENAECRMAVTADELLEFIEEFEPVTEGELVARLSELEEENARLEEGYQKSLGVIAATDCAECKWREYIKAYNKAYNDVLTLTIANIQKINEEDSRKKNGGAEDATDITKVNEADKLLYDYGIKDISTLEYILDQYQKVIVNITNGRMSYLTYPAEAILSVASDIYNEDLEKAINDAVTDRVAYINGGADG